MKLSSSSRLFLTSKCAQTESSDSNFVFRKMNLQGTLKNPLKNNIWSASCTFRIRHMINLKSPRFFIIFLNARSEKDTFEGKPLVFEGLKQHYFKLNISSFSFQLLLNSVPSNCMENNAPGFVFVHAWIHRSSPFPSREGHFSRGNGTFSMTYFSKDTSLLKHFLFPSNVDITG